MDVASLCRREVVGIDAEASLRRAAGLMREEHVGALVVMTRHEPPQVVGVVTDRDLAIDGLGQSGDPDTTAVGSLVRARPLAVPGTASVGDAVAAMEQAGVRRLLVVDPDGGVVGLLSFDDLLAAVSEELEALARTLRKNIEREKARPEPASAPAPRPRPVFPAFGTAATS
jgi:CBS domain-containing protein